MLRGNGPETRNGPVDIQMVYQIGSPWRHLANTNMTEPSVCGGYADGSIVFGRWRQCALPLNYAQYNGVAPTKWGSYCDHRYVT